MANIRVNLGGTIVDGQPVTFRSPANCSEVTGLIVYYPNGDTTASKTFQFADAHGNNVGSKNLFAADVLVKVLLDTEKSRAYVQNADTNAYLEAQLAKKYSPDNKPTAKDVGSVSGLWGNRSIYVEVTGNDTTGDGSQASPFASITRALDSLPHNLQGCTVSIYVGDGEFDALTYAGLYNGRIYIYGSDATIIKGYVYFANVDCNLLLSKLIVTATEKTQSYLLGLIGCSYAHVSACTFNGLSNTFDGVNVLDGSSSVGLSSCIFNNCRYCVSTNHSSGMAGVCNVSIYGCSGTNNTAVVYNNFATVAMYNSSDARCGATTLAVSTSTMGPIWVDGFPYKKVAQSNAKTALSTQTWAETLRTSNWVEETTGVFRQTLSIPGILAVDTPTIGPVYTTEVATNELIKEAWNMIFRIFTEAGTLIAYCYGEAPTANIPIQIQCVR